MSEQKKTSELYARLLRYRGSIREIERRTGVSRNTVSAHLRGKPGYTDLKILTEAQVVLKEYEANEREAQAMRERPILNGIGYTYSIEEEIRPMAAAAI